MKMSYEEYLREVEERRTNIIRDRIALLDNLASSTKSKFLRNLYVGLRNEHEKDLLT